MRGYGLAVPDPFALVRLPLQLGLRAGGIALQVGAGVARRAAELVGGGGPAATDAATIRPRPARVTVSTPKAKPRRRARPAPESPHLPGPRRRSTCPRSRSRWPPSPRPARRTRRARRSQIAEPWDGYDRLRAQEVQRELGGAGREVAAAVALYEAAGRGRRTVVAAAERRLAALDAAARS